MQGRTSCIVVSFMLATSVAINRQLDRGHRSNCSASTHAAGQKSPLRFIHACAFLLLLCGRGGAMPPGANGEGGQRVPADYRQLVARNIMASKMDLAKLVSAEISSPGEWEGPFGLGGKRPIVCVRLTIDGPIIRRTYSLGYTFQNGEIAEVFDPDSINPAA